MDWLYDLLSFFRFDEPNVKVVFWGSLLLGAVSGLVGSFTFLRKQSLIGDVIAHSVLPGICLAFIIGREKNPIVLLVGASIAGWLSTIAVDYITSRTKIKSDTAIALVLSVFFGVGVLLLTKIQHSGIASQSGLDQFIFGRAAAMSRQDVMLFSILGSLITLVVLAFFRGFKMLSFDPAYAESIGFPMDVLRLILSALTVMTVAMGVQAVGVVLMSALLITPAAAARFWTNRIGRMVLLSVLISAFSGVMGSAISYTYNGMPTGPWIVVMVSLFALLSALLGRESGLLKKQWIRWQNNRKIRLENTLKTFFYLTESFKKVDKSVDHKVLVEFSRMEKSDLNKGLGMMRRQGLVEKISSVWTLTQEGEKKSVAVVRKHRLWELYISKYMHLKPDHVHDDAEGIEHIITPEIEKELMEQLDFPSLDPHNNEIPTYE
jgi:manganese/zinc/iron transport system permease protein